jgi:hypothetical protein
MSLLRSLPRVAAGGALLALVALAAGRIGRRGGLPAPDALLAIGAGRAGEIALLGAGLALVATLLLRPLPEFLGRALRGGFWTGLAAMAILQQGASFLLFHLFRALPNPGFSLEPLPALGGMPAYVALLLAGGLAGVLLALAVQWFPLLWLPGADLVLGVAAGAAGLSQLAGLLPLPPLTTLPPGWWVNLVANGAWGLGTVLMLRPLELLGSE